MGDQHQFVRPGQKEILDPADGGDVQVVGGLVQKQQVRLRDQHLGQVEPHLETAGKIEGIANHIPIGKPQTDKDFLHLPVVVLFGGRQSFHAFGQDRLFGKPDVLAHVADAVALGHGDGAVVVALFADDDPKQGGLAVAVAAHQTHPLLGIDFEADAVEQFATAEAFT